MEQKEFQTILGGGNREIPLMNKRRSSLRAFLFLLVILSLGVGYIFYEISSPREFIPNTFVLIPDGATLGKIAAQLEERHIIRSALFFNVAVAHLGKEKDIASGMYLFKEAADVLAVANRMAKSDHGIETKKITLPEGFSIKDMSDTFSRELPNFDRTQFLVDTAGKEGYLFPDTYFFLSTATSGPVLDALTDNFTKKTAELLTEATTAKQKWSDLIIMASLLEGEAQTATDRRIVAQVLWKRIGIGMRLGVDAPFVYTFGKGSRELTQSDLASDSPYNTYRYAGLPPTPIGNPGIDAIVAAMHPATTTYLYYLSDKQGNMHYAKTFEEHKLNKTKFVY